MIFSDGKKRDSMWCYLYNQLNKIMKKNTSQEKDRRIQFTHPQKTSFLSVSPRNDNSHMFSGQPGEMKRHDTC